MTGARGLAWGSAGPVRAYLEEGRRRVFAGALEWPGWCRGGRDAEAALQALVDYGPRYAEALGPGFGFRPPEDRSALQVVERLPGNPTTDFGAPGAPASGDGRVLDRDEADRQAAVLRACWEKFDRAARAAAGRVLRKGPRGGGRELPAIVEHVLGAEEAYLRSMGGPVPPAGGDVASRMAAVRSAFLETFTVRALGGPAPRTPRSGKLWPPGFGVRRSAWHALDHAWEIEDRAGTGG